MTAPRTRLRATPRRARIKPRTPDEILEEISRTPHPDVARDPDESLAALERLIREARAAVREQRRWEQPTYRHASPRFTDAMKRIDAAPVWELRAFTRFLADVLWGLGDGTSRARPRRLEMEKEWDCAGILSDVSFDIRRRSFNPFPVSGGVRPPLCANPARR